MPFGRLTRHDLARAARLFALLAVAVRLAAGIVPIPASAWQSVLNGGEICHAPGGEAPAPGQSDHAAHDCTLCPACLTALPLLANAAPPAPSAPAVMAVRFLLPAPGAGPPARAFAQARPRGPPAAV